jgi:hypothetical protein
MNLGVIIQANGTTAEDLRKIAQYRPAHVILDVQTNDDLRIVDLFSKLEISTFLMLTPGVLRPEIMTLTAATAFQLLGNGRLYLKTHYGANEKLFEEIRLFFNQLSQEKLAEEVFLTAPASHFFNMESITTKTFRVSRAVGLATHPSYRISNSIDSLSIFNNKAFLQVLHTDEQAEFDIQILPPIAETFEVVTSWNRPTHIWSLRSFISFKESVQFQMPILAICKIVRDRTSAWEDQTCTLRAVRKLNVGDPDLEIVEFLKGNVGKTLDGDYVYLPSFDMKRL